MEFAELPETVLLGWLRLLVGVTESFLTQVPLLRRLTSITERETFTQAFLFAAGWGLATII